MRAGRRARSARGGGVAWLALVVALVTAAGATPATAAPRPRVTIGVVLGIPGFTADVYVDGRRRARGVPPGTTVAGLRMAPGVHEVAIRKAGAPRRGQARLSTSFLLTERMSASVVAHLDGRGRATVSYFENFVVPLGRRESRIVFRQMAAGPPVDVLLDGKPLLAYVQGPGQRERRVPAGRRTLEVVEHGGEARLLEPVPLALRAGTSYAIYLVGSAEEGTVVHLVQALDGRGLICGPGVPGCGDPSLGRRRRTTPEGLWRQYPLGEEALGGDAEGPATDADGAPPTAAGSGAATGATGTEEPGDAATDGDSATTPGAATTAGAETGGGATTGGGEATGGVTTGGGETTGGTGVGEAAAEQAAGEAAPARGADGDGGGGGGAGAWPVVLAGLAGLLAAGVVVLRRGDRGRRLGRWTARSRQ